MKYAFLSGGTGTPKLLQGFRKLVKEEEIAIICNNGDDYQWNGLFICPDLDTVLYQFSERLDEKKFWGVKDDSFEVLNVLKSLDADDTWFNVGDRDLALHIFRNHKLKTESLTEITHQIRQAWGIKSIIVPMSNHSIQSRIISGSMSYHFQEYFVKHRTQIHVDRVEFIGDHKSTTKEVEDILNVSKAIIIGPSNPVTSISPILAIDRIKELLQQHRKKVILISPIIGNKAFSGPTIKLMEAMHIHPSPIGLAKFYQKYVSKVVFDKSDKKVKNQILSLDIEPVFHSIEMSNQEQKTKLAKSILDFI